MLNQESETCEEKLQRMVKSIAEDISNGNEIGGAYDWIEKTEVYSIEWITTQDHNYKAARLLVAGGGPNIWINLQTNQVEGYWGADKCVWGFHDSIGLDDHYCEEFENSIDNLKNS